MIRKRIAVAHAHLAEGPVAQPVVDLSNKHVLMTAGEYLNHTAMDASDYGRQQIFRRLMNVLANEISPSGLAYILQVPKEAVVDCPEDVAAEEAREQALAEAAAGTYGQG